MLIGVRVDNTKELVALANGYRESTKSWADLLPEEDRWWRPTASATAPRGTRSTLQRPEPFTTITTVRRNFSSGRCVSLVCVHFHHKMAGQMTAEMFDVFYRGTVRRLTRYAFGLTGDQGESQDLVQEAYTRAWQHWRRVSAYDDAEAWLRLVVNRLAKDRWRRLALRRAAAASARPMLSVAGPSEETVLLVAAMRQLPFDQRQALVLFHLMDRSLADIAAETRTNLSTVKSRLTRGRASLAAVLGTRTVTNAGGAHVNGA